MTAEWTVDELAQKVALPTSTLRMYQSKGLLHPPTKRGRVGWYNEQHVGRLALIASLQERGFSLAAIKQLIDGWDAGASLEGLLGVQRVAPALQRTELRLTLKELAERFGDTPLTQTDMQRASALGAIEVEGSTVLIPDANFLDVGTRLLDLGLTVSEVLDEFEAMQPLIGSIVSQFADVFDRHVWSDFQDRGLPSEELPQIADTVQELAELANRVVIGAMQAEFIALAEARLAEAEAP